MRSLLLSVVCFMCTSFMALNAYEAAKKTKIVNSVETKRIQFWKPRPAGAQLVYNLECGPNDYWNFADSKLVLPEARRVGVGSVWGNYYCASEVWERDVKRIYKPSLTKNWLGLPRFYYICDTNYGADRFVREDVGYYLPLGPNIPNLNYSKLRVNNDLASDAGWWYGNY